MRSQRKNLPRIVRTAPSPGPQGLWTMWPGRALLGVFLGSSLYADRSAGGQLPWNLDLLLRPSFGTSIPRFTRRRRGFASPSLMAPASLATPPLSIRPGLGLTLKSGRSSFFLSFLAFTSFCFCHPGGPVPFPSFPSRAAVCIAEPVGACSSSSSAFLPLASPISGPPHTGESRTWQPPRLLAPRCCLSFCG